MSFQLGKTVPRLQGQPEVFDMPPQDFDAIEFGRIRRQKFHKHVQPFPPLFGGLHQVGVMRRSVVKDNMTRFGLVCPLFDKPLDSGNHASVVKGLVKDRTIEHSGLAQESEDVQAFAMAACADPERSVVMLPRPRLGGLKRKPRRVGIHEVKNARGFTFFKFAESLLDALVLFRTGALSRAFGHPLETVRRRAQTPTKR